MQNRMTLSPILTGTNFIPNELTNGCSLVAIRAGEGVSDTVPTEGSGAGTGDGVGKTGKTTSFGTKAIRVTPAAATSGIQTSQSTFLRFVVRAGVFCFSILGCCFGLTGLMVGATTGRDLCGSRLTLGGSGLGNIWRQAATFCGRRSGETAKPASIASRNRLLYLSRNRAASGVNLSRAPARSTA